MSHQETTQAERSMLRRQLAARSPYVARLVQKIDEPRLATGDDDEDEATDNGVLRSGPAVAPSPQARDRGGEPLPGSGLKPGVVPAGVPQPCWAERTP